MTLEQLSKLDDAELSRMAAEKVMGWREIVSRIDPVGNVAAPCHLWEGEQPGDGLPFSHWQPAVDRNQSGELLAAMAARGVSFLITRCVEGDPLGEDIEINIPNHHGYCIPGSDARAETMAALMAAIAMEEEATHA